MKDLKKKTEYKRKELATATGLGIEAIRFYEDKGLVSPKRDTNGYRIYSESDVEKVVFVSHAKHLGFSLKEANELLNLDPTDKDQAHEKVSIKIKELDHKIDELTKIKNSLIKLSDACCDSRNTDKHECPILKYMKECNEEEWHNAHRHTRNS